MEESLQYENERSKKDCVSGCVIERNEKMKLYEDIQSLLEEISFTKLKESFELDFDFIQVFNTEIFCNNQIRQRTVCVNINFEISY